MAYEPGSDTKIPSALNLRLDHGSLHFSLAFNNHMPPFLDNSVNADRGHIAKALKTVSKGPALAAPASVLRDIVTTFEESNARVARRFLGRSDGKLFLDLEYSQNPEGAALATERAVEVSAHL